MEKAKNSGWTIVVSNVLVLLICTVVLFISQCQNIKAWNSNDTNKVLQIEGEANLLKQESEKRILVEEAKAKLDVAKLQAQAEVERAKGVVEANKIIGDSLKENEAYLRYLWINALNENEQNVIYVPTEANLPIMEAGKR